MKSYCHWFSWQDRIWEAGLCLGRALWWGESDVCPDLEEDTSEENKKGA